MNCVYNVERNHIRYGETLLNVELKIGYNPLTVI